MTSLLAILTAATALLPSAHITKDVPKEATHDGTIIVKILPGQRIDADVNYLIEGETPALSSDARFEAMKNKLNERFSKMFQLKRELEKAQEGFSAKWDEYYTMNEAYRKELKKLVADWVTDNMYENK